MAPRLPALRELIRERPHDAGCRSIYADVLLERGDPRGLFIQAQQSGQHSLAASLLETYRAHFVHPLGLHADVTFVDGFIDAWRTSPGEFRSAGRRLLHTWPLRSLTVAHARQVDVRYVLESTGLARVSELSFPHLRSGGLQFLATTTLPPIRSLHVSGALMQSEIEALPPTPFARRLIASARSFGTDRFARWLEERFESPFAAITRSDGESPAP